MGRTIPSWTTSVGAGAPPVPFYGPTILDVTSVPNQVGLKSQDTPAVKNPSDPSLFADLISNMDLTFKFRLSTIWRFSDLTIYTLATVDWAVWFKASRVNGVLTPDPASGVSAQPFVRSHL